MVAGFNKVGAILLGLIVVLVLVFVLRNQFVQRAQPMLFNSSDSLVDELDPRPNIDAGSDRVETTFALMRLRDDIRKAFESEKDSCVFFFSEPLPLKYSQRINLFLENRDDGVVMKYNHGTFSADNWEHTFENIENVGWIRQSTFRGNTIKSIEDVTLYRNGELNRRSARAAAITSRYRLDVAKKEGNTLFFYYNPSAEEEAFINDEANKC